MRHRFSLSPIDMLHLRRSLGIGVSRRASASISVQSKSIYLPISYKNRQLSPMQLNKNKLAFLPGKILPKIEIDSATGADLPAQAG
jgi:hypothetical protein